MAARKTEKADAGKETWKGIALSAIVFVIVAQVVHTVGAILMMGYYTNPAYFQLWSKFMMSAAGPPGPEFFAISILFALAMGMISAWSYSLLKGSVPGTGTRKGLNFGLLLYLLAGVPYTLTNYLLLAVPPLLLFSWSIETLVIYAACGAAFSRLIR